MTITITGPKHTAHLCVQEITALINDPNPYGPGTYRGRKRRAWQELCELCLSRVHVFVAE